MNYKSLSFNEVDKMSDLNIKKLFFNIIQLGDNLYNKEDKLYYKLNYYVNSDKIIPIKIKRDWVYNFYNYIIVEEKSINKFFDNFMSDLEVKIRNYEEGTLYKKKRNKFYLQENSRDYKLEDLHLYRFYRFEIIKEIKNNIFNINTFAKEHDVSIENVHNIINRLKNYGLIEEIED